MRHYEVILIVNVAQEDRLSSLRQRYRQLVEKHKGQVHRFENWGRRPLCYPIQGCDQATYLLYNIEVPMACIEELGHQFRINDSVIRHMFIRREQAISEKSVMLETIESEKQSRSTDRSARSSGSADATGTASKTSEAKAPEPKAVAGPADASSGAKDEADKENADSQSTGDAEKTDAAKLAGVKEETN